MAQPGKRLLKGLGTAPIEGLRMYTRRLRGPNIEILGGGGLTGLVGGSMSERSIGKLWGRALSSVNTLSLLGIAFVPMAQAKTCTLTECADIWAIHDGQANADHYPNQVPPVPGVQGVGVLQINGENVDHCSWDG